MSYEARETLPCPYLTLPYLTLPYLTLPYLTLPYLTLPYLTLPYLTLPYLTLQQGGTRTNSQCGTVPEGLPWMGEGPKLR
jgi:hypothetical protein